MRKKSKSRSSSTKLSPRSAVDDSVLVLNSVSSLRLLRAYTAIKDRAVQRRLVFLVEMIAASQR